MDFYRDGENCIKCGKGLVLGATALGGSTTISFFCPDCNAKMNDFQIFIECLQIAYKGFCLNRILHEGINSVVYKKFERQWNMIFISIELNYKIWIAKILEENYTHECLKNYVWSDPYNETKENIMKWRHEFMAHFNSSTLRNFKSFIKDNPLDDNSIKDLFYKIAKIADEYSLKKYQLTSTIKESFEKIEEETKLDSDQWLKNFKEKKIN